jgi:hypothetical protein
MANITEILGTDSISSSRPIINSNFQLLNDDIIDITGFINPTNATIENISSATVQSLTVLNGTNIATFNTTGITLNRDVTLVSKTTIGGQLVKSGIEGSVLSPVTNLTPNPADLDQSTYLIDGNFTLPDGNTEGQEVTVINVNSGASVTTSSVNLSVTVTLTNQGSTVTLRWIGSKWYIISSYDATMA